MRTEKKRRCRGERRDDTEERKSGETAERYFKKAAERRFGQIQTGRLQINDGRVRDRAPEFEKTIEYRPRRKDPELDLPLDSFDRDGYGVYTGTGARKTPEICEAGTDPLPGIRVIPAEITGKDYVDEDRYEDPYDPDTDDDYWDGLRGLH